MRRARLSHSVTSEDGGHAVKLGREPSMQGSGEVAARSDDCLARVLRPSSSEVPMSAVLVRLLFPATCASSLSWRLALSAATRREQALIGPHGVRVSA